MPQLGEKTTVGAIIVGCLVQAIFYVGVAYVVIHFVAKFW